MGEDLLEKGSGWRSLSSSSRHADDRQRASPPSSSSASAWRTLLVCRRPNSASKRFSFTLPPHHWHPTLSGSGCCPSCTTLLSTIVCGASRPLLLPLPPRLAGQPPAAGEALEPSVLHHLGGEVRHHLFGREVARNIPVLQPHDGTTRSCLATSARVDGRRRPTFAIGSTSSRASGRSSSKPSQFHGGAPRALSSGRNG